MVLPVSFFFLWKFFIQYAFSKNHDMQNNFKSKYIYYLALNLLIRAPFVMVTETYAVKLQILTEHDHEFGQFLYYTVIVYNALVRHF